MSRILIRASLAAKDVKNEKIRLNVHKQIRFVEFVAEDLGDPVLGFHLARAFDLRKMGFLYYVAASADTLGNALNRLARYSSIANEGIVLKILRENVPRVSFHYSGVARHIDRHQIEFWITALVRMCRHLTNSEVRPLQVRFAHRVKDPQNEFLKFIGANVQEHSGVDLVDLPLASWTLPIINADSYLHQCLVQFCEEALSRRKKIRRSSVTVKVENTITELLPHGQARLECVAAKLGVSPRTLSRQLSVEHSTFAKIRDNMRLALARRYLAERGLRVSQVAWLLGYKEVGSFTHAFRRWTGKSPRSAQDWRQ